MENLQAQQVTTLKQKLASDASIRLDLEQIIDYLPNSEYTLILFMEEQKVWQGAIPTPPDNYTPGSVELGLFLYWLHNPDLIDLSYFSEFERLAIKALFFVLKELLKPTKMTAENADYFNDNVLVYADGTVLGAEKYNTFDQGWFIAFLNLLESVIHKLWYCGSSLFAIEPRPIPLSGATPNTLNIAILGDWGTGDSISADVIAAIVSQDPAPDYIIHVGDVYYAGTPATTTPNASHYYQSGEEQANLITVWPSAYKGKSFTLNSNHEMYSGANGYFYEALDAANKGLDTPFTAQSGSSFFALQYGGWTILGLDSAYMASAASAFMDGSIGQPTDIQTTWIGNMGLDPEKTIVLTHHNAFAYDCSSGSSLWTEVNGALKGDPYAWYWGHVHNGIVYDSPITIPATKEAPGISTNTFTRCLGHGGLPYGPASTLNGAPVAWCAGSAQPDSPLLYNGFAVLTLTMDETQQLTGITENFYDLSSPTAKWSKKIF